MRGRIVGHGSAQRWRARRYSTGTANGQGSRGAQKLSDVACTTSGSVRTIASTSSAPARPPRPGRSHRRPPRRGRDGRCAMLTPAPARVAPNRPMKPGLSWLVTYSMCAAEIGLDLDALDLDDARPGAGEQRAGDGAALPVGGPTVTRTRVWYSLGRSCTVSATSMPRSRASSGALTMLHRVHQRRAAARPGPPRSAAAWFSCGGVPSYSIGNATHDAVARCTSWPANAPSSSAQLHVGLQARRVLGRHDWPC